MRPRGNKTGLLLLLSLLLPLGAQYAQYVQDNSFGVGGHLILEEDTVTSAVHGLRLDDDCMLILSQVGPVGATVADRDVLLCKYGPEGQVDSTFGQGGQLRFDFDSLSCSTGIHLMLEPDGSFLVLGSGKSDANSARTWGCLQRVSPNGSLLPLSPQLAALRYEVMGLEEYPNLLQRDPAGRYLIAGSTFDPLGNHPQPVVLRYTPDWVPDSTFGGTGRILFDFGATISLRGNAVHFSGGFVRDLVALPDSGLAICGALSNGDHYVGFVAGIAKDGSLATGFCPPQGYATFDLFDGYDTRIQGIERLADGTILFAGSAHPAHPNPDLLLGRLNPGNGSSTYEKIDLGGGRDEFADLALRSDGGLLLLSSSESEGATTMALVEVPDVDRLEEWSAAGYSPDATQEARGHFILQQTDRVILGGFQLGSGAGIHGLLTAVRRPYVSAAADISATSSISIFPNPTHDHLTIRCFEGIREVSLRSVQGDLCFERSLAMGNVANLELPTLAPGAYILTVNGRWREKVVVF